MTGNRKSFEDGLERLEELVRVLEQNELGLEQSLEAFEEGTKLAESLTKELEKAQKRVMKLMKSEQGEFELTPLDEEEELPND